MVASSTLAWHITNGQWTLEVIEEADDAACDAGQFESPTPLVGVTLRNAEQN